MDAGNGATELRQGPWPEAAETRERHAVQIAARGKLAGVEVGMRIEPEHTQLPARLAAVPCHGADRADAERVIAPEEDGQPSGAQLLIYRGVREPVPFQHCLEMAVPFDGRLPGVAGAGKIAAIHYLQPALFERTLNAGDPHRLWPHRGAALRRPHIRGSADQAHRA